MITTCRSNVRNGKQEQQGYFLKDTPIESQVAGLGRGSPVETPNPMSKADPDLQPPGS